MKGVGKHEQRAQPVAEADELEGFRSGRGEGALRQTAATPLGAQRADPEAGEGAGLLLGDSFVILSASFLRTAGSVILRA